MYGKISLKDYAGHANLPLPTVYVRQGSAATIGFLDVPDAATSVSFTAVNVAGVALTVAAAKVDGIWTATLPASHFAAAGNVENGITIKASDGTSEWSLGVGGLVVLSAEATPAPGETATTVTDKTLDGEEMDTGTIGGLREAVRKLGGALGATVTALALCVQAMPLQDIPVTNDVYTAAETDAAIVAATSAIPFSTSSITTNDVCSIVTNEVVEFKAWVSSAPDVLPGDSLQWGMYDGGGELEEWGWICETISYYPLSNDTNATRIAISASDVREMIPEYTSEDDVVFTRQPITRNALGLARLSDIDRLTTTNDVCAIVTNEVENGFTKWTIYRDDVDITSQVRQPTWGEYPEGTGWWIVNSMTDGSFGPIAYADPASGDLATEDATVIYWDGEDADYNAISYHATRTSITRNALGLARLVDLPPLTNGLATAASVAAADTRATDAQTMAAAASNYTARVDAELSAISNRAPAVVDTGLGVRWVLKATNGVIYAEVEQQ